ncbi:Cytochrome P450-DIT2 [Cyberlindnera fabianii]|uniref:Cytochrome P450-DIT2 n=1 Tax=Cyberlindnera fabianii TaxID=36022 RepID=A0A1V2L550_CYBFA|nr:Cytochrome P450-DIT2 [Cyberlindnera fabianii]
MSLISLIGYTLVGVLLYAVLSVVFPPLNFPHNIPTIPFYVSFLGTYTKMDQRDIYERYLRTKLEKYGAVKIYFANRWNILVVKPEYLNQMFKEEDVFAKSGNHKKIPHAVLSHYTGDNVISAHGATWKTYRSIIQKSVQFPERSHVYINTKKFVSIIDDAIEDGDPKICERALPVSDFLQRLSLANISQSMLGVDFGTLDSPNSELHRRLKIVKSHIFKPIYMNFPVLDQLPIKSRILAREEVHNFRKFYAEKVIEAQKDSTKELNEDSAAYQLYKSLQRGDITEKQFIDNLVIILVAGHENPQLFFTSLLYILAKYPEVQSRLYRELQATDYEDLDNAPYLASVIFETLRFFPPLGQIINRCASRNAVLGGDIHVPKGTYLGYNNYATTHSSAWTNSDSFIPERWGSDLDEVMKNYKRAKSNATLPSFHGGKRACLGERFALFESKMFLKGVLEKFEIKMDETWVEKLTPAGPICPLMLRVVFKRR